MRLPRAVGILCGGGPAPGINNVIGGATIRAELAAFRLSAFATGSKVLVDGKPEACTRLTIEDVSRIHFSGASYLGTSRDPADLARVAETLAAMDGLANARPRSCPSTSHMLSNKAVLPVDQERRLQRRRVSVRQAGQWALSGPPAQMR